MKQVLAAIAVTVLLAGCVKSPASDGHQKGTTPTTAPTAPATGELEASKPAPAPLEQTAANSDGLEYLKAGQAYASARRALLEHGWQPLPDQMCMSNVVGADYETSCKTGSEICRVCGELPELSSYSGDAHALSQFKDPAGRILRLTSLGELVTWNKPEPDADLQVLSWEIEKPSEAR